ncbi:uncharacterized protein DS421_11g322780 [Arachis hypogaea]|nr:uncharacterized protein DS421_11g322780 [Arachis hypogaea]
MLLIALSNATYTPHGPIYMLFVAIINTLQERSAICNIIHLIPRLIKNNFFRNTSGRINNNHLNY